MNSSLLNIIADYLKGLEPRLFRVTDNYGNMTLQEVEEEEEAIKNHLHVVFGSQEEVPPSSCDDPLASLPPDYEYVVENYIDDELDGFSNIMRVKWFKGAVKHKGDSNKFDALKELREELVDLANYAMAEFWRLSELEDQINRKEDA